MDVRYKEKHIQPLNPAGRNLRSVWDIEEENDNLLAQLDVAISEGIVTKEQVLALLPKRDKTSVWDIPTQPFPEAHFATFPEKIPEICIKAGTSEKGRCPACGSPWERVVDYKANYEKREPAHAPNNEPSKVDSTGWKPPIIKQKGWQPTCKCDLEPEPCVVLDPFAGSGTVGKVAKRLGRRSILVELKEEYCEMTVKQVCQQELALS